jgi:serine/threonine-protein phosphatase PP1 catalytic subunit
MRPNLIFTGLSPDLQSMEQIRRIMRPTDVPDTGKDRSRSHTQVRTGQENMSQIQVRTGQGHTQVRTGQENNETHRCPRYR